MRFRMKCVNDFDSSEFVLEKAILMRAKMFFESEKKIVRKRVRKKKNKLKMILPWEEKWRNQISFPAKIDWIKLSIEKALNLV